MSKYSLALGLAGGVGVKLVTTRTAGVVEEAILGFARAKIKVVRMISRIRFADARNCPPRAF